jgi:hypothetical protein
MDAGFSFTGCVSNTARGPAVAHVAKEAKELGVSLQCAHRQVATFDADGEAGLLDRSCRPRTSPTRTPSRAEQRVLAARRRWRRGPAGLAHLTGIPTAICGRRVPPAPASWPAPQPGSQATASPSAGS